MEIADAMRDQAAQTLKVARANLALAKTGGLGAAAGRTGPGSSVRLEQIAAAEGAVESAEQQMREIEAAAERAARAVRGATSERMTEAAEQVRRVRVEVEQVSKILTAASESPAAKDLTDSIKQASTSMQGSLEEVRNAADKTQRTFDTVFTHLEGRALAGAENIGDVMRNLAREVALMFARGAVTGGGPLGGAITDALGGSLSGALSSGISGLFSPTPATPAQVAAFPLPQFASGTSFAPGGPALVGERGPEIVDLPRGSRVTPNDGLGGVTVNVDARGATDPAATEAAARRGAEAALTQVPGIVQNMRRWRQI